MHRRHFLRTGAGCVAAMAWLGTRACAAEEKIALSDRTKGSLAFQLWCLSGEQKTDPKKFHAAIRKLAHLGFEGVELGPDYRNYCSGATERKHQGTPADPKEIGKIIRDAGLAITSSHIFPASEMMGDRLKANIEWQQAVCNKIVIISDSKRYLAKNTKDAWLAFAGKFTEIAEALRPLGMQTGYHSHSGDFEPVSDAKDIPWDLIFGNTPKDVVMEIDYDNVRKHHDLVLKAIKDCAGRGVRMHFKRTAGIWGAWEKNPRFTAQHKELFDLYETVGKCEWYIIEDPATGTGNLDALKGHVEFFRKLGKL